MPQQTPKSIRYFQQLYNHANKLSRMNTRAIIVEGSKKEQDRDWDLLRNLYANRDAIQTLFDEILAAEQAYVTSNVGESEAEKALRDAARSASEFIKTIKTITEMLTAASNLVSILARVITLIT